MICVIKGDKWATAKRKLTGKITVLESVFVSSRKEKDITFCTEARKASPE